MTAFDELSDFGVTFIGDNPIGVQLGFGSRKDMIFETPVQLRPGKYDVGRIGAFTYLGGDDSIFRYIKSIGRYCSIAGGIKSGLVEHPTDYLSTHPLFYGQWQAWPELSSFYQQNHNEVSKAKNEVTNRIGKRINQIEIGNDVWIGENVTILRGVKIGDGAIVASCALVNADVPPYSIVGGVPAKLIKYRFDNKYIEKLLTLKWWNYDPSVMKGVDFTDIEQAIIQLELNTLNAPALSCKTILLDTSNNVREL